MSEHIYWSCYWLPLDIEQRGLQMLPNQDQKNSVIDTPPHPSLRCLPEGDMLGPALPQDRLSLSKEDWQVPLTAGFAQDCLRALAGGEALGRRPYLEGCQALAQVCRLFGGQLAYMGPQQAALWHPSTCSPSSPLLGACRRGMLGMKYLLPKLSGALCLPTVKTPHCSRWSPCLPTSLFIKCQRSGTGQENVAKSAHSYDLFHSCLFRDLQQS